MAEASHLIGGIETNNRISKPTEVSLLKEIDYRIWVMSARTLEALNRARKVELTSLGVSGVEALALFVIRDAGSFCTPAEVARRMAREHSTVTALLARMQKKGLVSREKDPGNKHLWLISITERGFQACNEAAKLDCIHNAMLTLSEDEKIALENNLRTIFEKASSQYLNTVMFK